MGNRPEPDRVRLKHCKAEGLLRKPDAESDIGPPGRPGFPAHAGLIFSYRPTTNGSPAEISQLAGQSLATSPPMIQAHSRSREPLLALA